MFIPLCALSLLSVSPGVEDWPQTPPPTYSKTLDADAVAWVDATLKSLTVEELVGQLAMDWTSGAYESIEDDGFTGQIDLVENGMGGLWIMFGMPHSCAVRINELQKRAKVPLLVFGVGRLGVPTQGAGTDFPSAMAYAAIGEDDVIREAVKHVGIEARAIGGHILGNDGGANLLVDLSNVLANRALGDDPKQAARLTAACLEGANQGGTVDCVGFWPGFSVAFGDPHITLPLSTESREHFYDEAFVPYKRAVSAGMDVLMTSHFAVPSLSGSKTIPATLSPKILNIVRDELGYDGVLITDAMAMGGITNNYDFVEASVMAFEAGHDIILGPNVPGFTKLMLEKIESREISLEQVRTSVRRVLTLKAKLGLHKNRFVDLNDINKIVGRKEHQNAADLAAERSITLVRDEENLVPMPAAQNVLSITYERADDKTAGQAFDRGLRAGVTELESARLSPQSEADEYEGLLEKARQADKVVLSIYLRPQLYEGEYADVSDELIAFRQKLRDLGIDVIVLSFGKLSILDRLPEAETLLMAWSPQDVMQRAAAKAVLGQTPIGGKLPLSLAPHHKRGEGLTRLKVQPIGLT